MNKFNFLIKWILILIIVIGIILIPGCIEDKKNDSKKNHYVEGELYILFNDTINDSQARDIIKSYELDLLYAPSNNSGAYKVKVPIGKENYYIEILTENKYIEKVERVKEDP